ncbi:uncharacterized protein LOC113225612 [Hyposmocoma kahamanoa]|uniref:uncharacterized protein LOC113225612 n=1 Tax=Hyposmocoma kahamanoa TaxID=1477025 RepID=UPI000E6DA099|nr:uncharacterized protein LOC113225612 [Hyposmocoma kahamanoa]
MSKLYFHLGCITSYLKMQTEVINSNIEIYQATDDATTSRKLDVNPMYSSHNMNDLDTLNYQSADDIRQTMKAVLSGKQRNVYDGIEDASSTPTTHNKFSHNSGSQKLKKEDCGLRLHVVDSNTNCKSTAALRKRGRPPKAGPSKKFKQIKNVAELYKGKLSNVVQSPGIGCSNNSFSDTDWFYWHCKYCNTFNLN